MKRLLSICLAIAMLFSMPATAFAQGIIPTADKTLVKKGEQVVVTTTMEETVSGVTTAEFRLAYDEDMFEFDFDNSVPRECDIAKSGDVGGQVWNGYVKCNYSNTRTAGGTIAAGAELAILKFTAKKDVTTEEEATFTSSVYTFAKADGTHPVSDFPNKSIKVTVAPAAEAAKGYSMEVKAENPSVVVGEQTRVALKITNSDSAVTTYNAYHVVVTYDSNSLTYESSNLAADAVDLSAAGTLKITGYGADKTCGTDDIELTFTTKKVGTPKVTVTSAKVDAKANASAKDAPAATLTTAEATITVGGYKVTLPGDIFTGAGTVNPGENYTFTAKDTSKKYDFTGSTMGGNAVTIKDNGNGTYTVENVIGELVIKATEKVSKVKINLSGDAKDKVISKSWGDAAEVDAGTALWFMATPDSGKELVVTVNGEVITGTNQQGQMRYTITADKVTGPELNIDVNYKAANTITIFETGDAWSGLTRITRNGWDASGDEIPADIGSISLRFKFANEKTLDDFVITINGDPANVRKSGPFYTFDFNASEVGKNGVITIDVSYKKTEPIYTVDVSKYLELDGQTMYLVTATGDVAEGKVLAYDGNQMYWSDEYNKENGGAYAWLIIPDETSGTKTPEDLKTEAVAAIKAVEGKKISIDYGGDVNLTNAVDINDAQFVWNMYNAEYKDDTNFETVNRQKYLTADVNHDGKLDTKDAAAVVDIIKK